MNHDKMLLNKEVIYYIFFGGLTTAVYAVSRLLFYGLFRSVILTTTLANAVAICFAFVMNDRFVFRQETVGWFRRFMAFLGSRVISFGLDLGLAYCLVERYPFIIGVFVNHDSRRIHLVELVFSQILLILLNYVMSKYVVFTKKHLPRE